MSTAIGSGIPRTTRSLGLDVDFIEQQSVADSEFVELEDALVNKARNIPEGNVES